MKREGVKREGVKRWEVGQGEDTTFGPVQSVARKQLTRSLLRVSLLLRGRGVDAGSADEGVGLLLRRRLGHGWVFGSVGLWV